MIKNYLIITCRSMMRNKLFLLVNIFGLAIAIGCCIVAYFNWEFDAQFDKHHTRAENIYRVSSVREFNGEKTLVGYAPLPLGSAIRENVSDVDKVVRMSWSFSNFKIDDNLFPVRLAYADADFFDVFTFELLDGDASGLKDKSKVYISDEMAIKLFGHVDVTGQSLTQVLGNDLKEYLVGGVFKKQPANSSFGEDAYANYENFYDEAKDVREDDWKGRNVLFVLINHASRLEAVVKQLQTYRENNNKVREDFQISEFKVEPFDGMARRDASAERWANTQNASPPEAVISTVIMGILVLLIACFNMTNTAIAISSRRLKEIGLRKVMGGMRSQLIVQFLGETTFICAIALFLGFFAGEVLLTGWNALWVDMKLTSHYSDNPGFLLFITGVLVFTALVAGGYPALYISHFEPVTILKGKLKLGGTNYFTRVLLGLQYAISLVALIFAIAFYANSLYQRDFDMGFDRSGVILAYVNNEDEFDAYRNALMQHKDIIAVSGSKHSILSSWYNNPVKHGTKELEVEIMDVGDDYISTMGMTLIAGRDFQTDSETDRKQSVVVSENFAKKFGWDDAIGKEIIWMDTVRLYVIGVVRDVYTQGLWREMEPVMLRYASRDQYSHVLVKASVAKLPEINRFMEEQWKTIFPNRVYNGWYLDEVMAEAVTVNNNIVKIFTFMGVIALVLSVTGLFTLVSLNIIRKMKEIGVRKVLGASVANIAAIINVEFIVILTLSAAAGTAASYFAVEALMSAIWRYYQPASALTFALSVSLMFLVSGIAIASKVYLAASMNPVKTLRDE